MHRTKTKFAKRINRVASALERRGIVYTYELHDRVLSNPKSRRRFAGDLPQLDAVQREIVGELEAGGYALVRFSDLFAEDGVWREIEDQARRFRESTEAVLTQGGGQAEGLRVRQGKEFVVRLHSYGVDLGLDDPWLRACLSRPMLDVANTYLGLWSKLEYVDMWYSAPQPENADRVSSQLWHRDYNDKHLLKVFLYLVDVDEETGPFEYVPGSAGAGPYAGLWPWAPLVVGRIAEQELAQRVPAGVVETFLAPKGTMIFCNTSGFHRGGFVTGKPRVLATATYSSPASLASLTERNYRFRSAGATQALDAAQQFALA